MIQNTPYTNFHELNLDWLIKKMKELENELDAGVLAINTFQEQLDRLETQYKTIPKQIADAVEHEMIGVRSTLNEFQLVLNGYGADISKIKIMNDSLQVQIWQVNSLLLLLNKQTNDNLIAYINRRFMNIAKEWPSLICPADGHLEDLQSILYHIYNRLSRGVPVQTFDSYQIKVEDFDNMEITVFDFDNYGEEFFKLKRACYMTSPFTGEYVPISKVVISLAGLHQKGIEVEAFDALDIDAETFDNENYNVYVFDWECQLI